MYNKIFGVELTNNDSTKNLLGHISGIAQNKNKLHNDIKQGEFPYFVLNTCRRFVLFTSTNCPGKLIRFFENNGVAKKYLNIYRKEKAIVHLLEIAAGLKSPNVGENEILHQLKNQLDEAREFGSLDAILENLVQKAIRVGKRVRAETSLSKNTLSYPALIFKILQSHFSNIAEKRLLVLGSGKLGQKCINYFVNKGTVVTIATRNKQRLKKAINKKINIISRNELTANLHEYDIFIGAASVTDELLKTNHFSEIQQKQVLIDLGMPANFEPAIKQLSPTKHLYNLCDIFRVSLPEKTKKNREIGKAHKIIEQEKGLFIEWLKNRRAAKIISALNEEIEQIKLDEKNQIISKIKDIDPDQIKLIDLVVHRLSARIAHKHYEHIKNFVAHE